MTDDELAAIERRAEAEWIQTWRNPYDPQHTESWLTEDAEAAREDIPALVAECRRLRERVGALRGALLVADAALDRLDEFGAHESTRDHVARVLSGIDGND
jgi:hypothetical protein